MLELQNSHRLGGLCDGVVIPVEIFVDRVDCASDVYVIHGGLNNAKQKVVISPASSGRY